MRTYKTEKLQTIFLSLAVIISMMILTVTEGFTAAETVREECLRLHILAASDSEEDQAVKLLVRDSLLESTGELFKSFKSADEAVIEVEKRKEELEAIAENVLRENGFSYNAEIFVTEEYFTSRQYEDVTLPAGNYKALKVVLGEGEGHNWWCVMFPPLCLPAVTEKNEDSVYGVFGENGGNLVTGKGGYKIKFKIVEIVEALIESIKS